MLLGSTTSNKIYQKVESVVLSSTKFACSRTSYDCPSAAVSNSRDLRAISLDTSSAYSGQVPEQATLPCLKFKFGPFRLWTSVAA